MAHYHAVVWIDHQKATVWHFTSTEQTNTVIHSHDKNRQVHSRKSTHGGHKAPPDRQYFDEIALALEGAHEILLIGPAQTKQEFATYLQDKHPQMRRAVVAVEDADHPTDPEVLAYARRHFKAIDRMFAPNA